MNTKEYNGWTNYETWNVKLWIDNEEPSYRYWRERAQMFVDEAEARSVFTAEEAATYDLADDLKKYHEQNMPEIDGTYSDLLGTALCEVNWGEIAHSLIEDLED